VTMLRSSVFSPVCVCSCLLLRVCALKCSSVHVANPYVQSCSCVYVFVVARVYSRVLYSVAVSMLKLLVQPCECV